MRQWAHIVTIQKPIYEGNSASFRLVSCRLGASVGVRTRLGTEPRSSRPPIFASSETPRPRPATESLATPNPIASGLTVSPARHKNLIATSAMGNTFATSNSPKNSGHGDSTQILSVPLLRNSRQTAASNRLSPRDSPKRRILFGTPFCRISLTTRSIEGVRPAAKRSAWAEVMHAVWAGVGALLRH